MSSKTENTFSSRISPFEKPNRNKGTTKRPKDFFGGEKEQMGHKDNSNPLKDRHQKKFRSN
jgi:hypothetical protein